MYKKMIPADVLCREPRSRERSTNSGHGDVARLEHRATDPHERYRPMVMDVANVKRHLSPAKEWARMTRDGVCSCSPSSEVFRRDLERRSSTPLDMSWFDRLDCVPRKKKRNTKR